jgi:hypothetical protein
MTAAARRGDGVQPRLHRDLRPHEPSAAACSSRASEHEHGPGVHTVKLGRVAGRHYAFLSVNPGDSGRGWSSWTSRTRRADGGMVGGHGPAVRARRLRSRRHAVRRALARRPAHLRHRRRRPRRHAVGARGRGQPHHGRPATSTTSGGSTTRRTARSGTSSSARRGPAAWGRTRVGRHPRHRRQRHGEPAAGRALRVAGAGTHNFWMDEPSGILYAAYYNGGVRASTCAATWARARRSRRRPQGSARCGSWAARSAWRCCTDSYVWGVVHQGDARLRQRHAPGPVQAGRVAAAALRRVRQSLRMTRSTSQSRSRVGSALCTRMRARATLPTT